jgi:hypothetical protein
MLSGTDVLRVYLVHALYARDGARQTLNSSELFTARRASEQQAQVLAEEPDRVQRDDGRHDNSR